MKLNSFEFDEFSKISLHTHFGNYDRTIDKNYGYKSNFDFEDAIKKLKEANANKFNIIGMTNSNILLPLEFIKLKKIAKILDIELICGIEINIKNETQEKYLHTVILFPTNINLVELALTFDQYFKINNSYCLKTNQLVELIFKFKKKAIIIPHGVKQSGGGRSSSKNKEQFEELIGFDISYPVLIEDNKTYHKERLRNELTDFLNSDELAWIDKTASVSAVDRNKDITFSSIGINATYIWGNNTFNDLYFASLMKKSRIKKYNDIITKANYIHKIVIKTKDNKNPPIQSATIFCSHGLNAIIGKSGSGKTLLLNEINYILKEKPLMNNVSNVNNKEGYHKICEEVDIKLYDINDNEINVINNWNVFEGENLYNKMLEIFTSDKSDVLTKFKLAPNFSEFNKLLIKFDAKINTYLTTYKSILESRNAIKASLNRIKDNKIFLKNNISTASTINEFSTTDLTKNLENIKINNEKINKDIEQIDKIKKWLSSIENKYQLNKSFNETIFAELKLIQNKITKTLLKNMMNYNDIQINQLKKIFLNKIIKNYNTKLGDKALGIVEKNKENIDSVETIIDELKSIYINKENLEIPILNEEQIKNAFNFDSTDEMQTEFDNINLEFTELEKLFPSNIGSQKNAINRSKFNSIKSVNLSIDKSVKSLLDVFVEENYIHSLTIDKDDKNYITFKIKLKDETGMYKSIDEMTAGQLGKLYISGFIKDGIKSLGGNLIVLFDQPENNLEKEYILNELIRKLDELKKEYQIFITTHEPLLVVNGDANNIILASNPKTVLQPNNIIYKNLSFVDRSISKDDMVKEIAKLIDGSHDAIKDRNRIYGGMLNGN